MRRAAMLSTFNPSNFRKEFSIMKKQALVINGQEEIKTARALGVVVRAEKLGATVFAGGHVLVITLEGEAAPQGINQIIERLLDNGIAFSRCFPVAA
jgi:hypothetical protein